ncbi:MAG TPA: hypothetical protein VGL25_16990 [Casimicrobiaceae bacterium]
MNTLLDIFEFASVVLRGLELVAQTVLLGSALFTLLIAVPIASVAGFEALWTRWLEVEAPNDEGRWSGWIWPICFILIGLLLLDYREA